MKILNGGVYWVDFREIRFPEWGNSVNEKPHLYIIIKQSNFHNSKSFIAIPVTSKFWIYSKHRNTSKEIILNNKKHYYLVNHIKSISNTRILKPYYVAGSNTKIIVCLTKKQLLDLKINISKHFNTIIDNLINQRD